MKDRFEGKVAFVTGGVGAFGSAIGLRMAQEGAKVILTDRSLDNQDEVRKLFAGLAAPLIWEHDVTSEEHWRTLIDRAVTETGRLDVVVNAAGVISPPSYVIDELPTAEWRRVMAVNVDGVFFGTREAIRAMKAQGGGAVVNIGSTSAFLSSVDAIPYNVSKATVRAITRNAAMSAGKSGYKVRVNAVHPTWVWTQLVEDKLVGRYGSKEKALAAIVPPHSMDHLPVPADVANAVAFLASDEARMITGADLMVDAGRLLA